MGKGVARLDELGQMQLQQEMSALADRVIDQVLMVRKKEYNFFDHKQTHGNPAINEGVEHYEVVLHTEVFVPQKNSSEEFGEVIFVGTKEEATSCATLTRAILMNTLARFLHARALILQKKKSIDAAVNAVLRKGRNIQKGGR